MAKGNHDYGNTLSRAITAKYGDDDITHFFVSYKNELPPIHLR